MNTYINAGRLIEQLDKKIPPRTGGNENYVRGFKDALLVFKSMIHSAMTADVQEVVHAHWEYYYDSMNETNLKCSKCGYKTNFKTKRCEGCDAKMDKEVHAHWIVTQNKHIFPEDRHDPNFWHRCSNCGKTYGAYTKSEAYEMKECPRCKAKMDEVE